MNQKNNKDKKEKSKAALIEESILKFWKEEKIFEKTLKNREGSEEYIFYDGPPFATGLPHWGSLLSSVAKDLVPRYFTMKGKYVRRRWGWDTHGLPIENMIEKRMELNDKTDIENKVGIKEFNETCRSAVLEFATDWEKYVDRIGRWVEFRDAYKTMDAEYMESVWHFLKTAHNKGLVYEGHKVLQYCPHDQTPLSKAETAMDDSYKDVKDISVTAEFEIEDEKDTFLLAWTTTPWTLPGNVALAVGVDIDYVKIEKKDEGSEEIVMFILAKEKLIDNFPEDNYEIVSEFKGKELVGKKYTAIFDTYQKDEDLENRENGWQIYAADFVDTESGTGIVHIAPAFGEDDFNLGKDNKMPLVVHVNSDGSFKKELGDIAGVKVKQVGDYHTADIEILKKLVEKGVLFSKLKISHSYPHCYRCGTPLLNYAISSWFLDLQKDKEKYLKLNEKVNWIPANLKNGRVKNLLEGAPDWTISRNRYWATPLPFWKNPKTEELFVIGSVEELKEKTKSSNRYTFIRHGESEANVADIFSDKIGKNGDKLTQKGKDQAVEAFNSLEDIDLIITSPFERTKETAKLISKNMVIDEDEIIIDDRLSERDFGVTDGESNQVFRDFVKSQQYSHDSKFKNGESTQDTVKRVMNFLFEIDKKYEGKNILIVTHDSIVTSVLIGRDGLNKKKATSFFKTWEGTKNAFPYELNFAPIPVNDSYELDFHRPYIDEITLKDKDGNLLERTPEVIDCWVESASMPFAEYHYPFENKEIFESRRPADFVSEYIAQTRTWFNYMHTVAGIMFDDVAFKNVLTTGNILAEDGTKMSKSKGNYTEPLELIDQISADAARFYMTDSVVMSAEDFEFADIGVREIQNKVINVMLNSLDFYKIFEPYYDQKYKAQDSENVLDRWILFRLAQVVERVDKNMEKYLLPKATRELKDFLSDLSKWYIRRSRDRFKSEDKVEKLYAIATLRFILVEFSKLIAPITPFTAEHVYREVGEKKESVHLEDYPVNSKAQKDFMKKNPDTSEIMERVRNIVSVGLQARVSEGLKVRQPLASATVLSEGGQEISENKGLCEIIKEELNIKEVYFKKAEKEEGVSIKVELDKKLTLDLQKEGDFRELLRSIQSMRKKAGLVVGDNIKLEIDINDDKDFIENFKTDLERVAGVKEIIYRELPEEQEIKNNKTNLKLKIHKL